MEDPSLWTNCGSTRWSLTLVCAPLIFNQHFLLTFIFRERFKALCLINRKCCYRWVKCNDILQLWDHTGHLVRGNRPPTSRGPPLRQTAKAYGQTRPNLWKQTDCGNESEPARPLWNIVAQCLCRFVVKLPSCRNYVTASFSLSSSDWSRLIWSWLLSSKVTRSHVFFFILRLRALHGL